MERKITFFLAVLFVVVTLLSYSFGNYIRNQISCQVEVMSPTFYTFSDGTSTLTGLSSSCFHSDEINTYAFIVVEQDFYGEKAYYAQKIDVVTGKSDGQCTELLQSTQFNAIYVRVSNATLQDGDRVVITKVHNSP